MSQNTICWADIPVADLERSIRFYSVILGKRLIKQSHEGVEFALLPHENDNVSGCLVAGDENRPSKQGSLIYLNVNGRMEEALDVVEENGGTVLQGRNPIGPYGFKAVILDSEGNRIGLHSET